MKKSQIIADVERLAKLNPNNPQNVKIRCLNKGIDVGVQYNGAGMYRALQIMPRVRKPIALTPWTNSTSVLENAIAAAGLELAPARPARPKRKSIWLYVDGQDFGMDVVEVALARNEMVDTTKQFLIQQFAPAQVTFKVETR